MIPEISISLMAIAGFGLALWWCRVVAATEDALMLSMAGLMSMLDSELDDAAKEAAVRRAGIELIASSFGVLWRLAVAVAAAAAPILLADRLGLASRTSVLELMVRLDYLLAVSVVAIVLGVMLRRWRPAADESSSANTRYSTADRLFHAMAFSSPRVLKAASRLEDRLIPTCAQEPSAPPIFVTSLARGGTTALLNALHDIPGIATHTYRDMPFLTAPSLWNRLAGGKMRRVDRHERAHGDGLQIDLDSPEAFEEVVWKIFWPEKFEAATIPLWHPEDRKEQAEEFLRRHMGKVIRTRLVQGRDETTESARYCSKNNANVARLPFLMDVFPGCRIVVPIRRPECHAASLLRQHQNFLTLQKEDEFIQRYMRDIGHFEFGLIHKPIRFPGFDDERYDPGTGDYWLNYWTHTFREVLRHAANCTLVTQDDLRATPQKTMTKLGSSLDLPQASLQFGIYFRSEPDDARSDLYDQRLYDEAAELYRELEEISL